MALSQIKVVIIEDQPSVRRDVQLLVQRQVGFSVAGACGTVKEAKQLLWEVKPELLLLDVHLPDGTGFDILEETPDLFKVIFLTAFEKHALQAIKIGALDYLLKPVEESELTLALTKALHSFPSKAEQIAIASRYHHEGVRSRLVLRSQDFLQVVELSQIIYCSSDAGYTTFHLSDGRKILVSKILKDYEDVLTEPTFLRPHQSYLVNSNYIDKYSKEGFIYLKNGVQIPVATRRKDMILNFFNRLL
jgi:two-component system LytT family response regulator